MRKGFVGTIIIILLLIATAGVLYYIYVNYAKTPNEKTLKVASSIYRYPDATSWEMKESKNFCFAMGGCAQPVRIMFETQNEWGSIYSYFMPYMTQSGWTTNSAVLTSIPTSVVFTRSDKCTVAMENHNELKYSLTVSCPDK